MKIKKGDTVHIGGGKDAGKSGKVLAVDTKHSTIIVEGLNMLKRHRKPRRQGEVGEIVAIARPMNISKVRLLCPRCGKPARVGFALPKDGKGIKTRMCKVCKAAL